VGVESKHEIYEKNRGVDFHALVAELRDAGVSVLASGILFFEQHDRKTIEEDIDFLVSLNADFVQFMELGPIPGTALWDDYERKSMLQPGLPWEECHGQDKIWFKHHTFERDETATILRSAFERDLQVNGASLLRFFETAARGALNLPETSERLRARRRQHIERCRLYRPLLRSIRLLAPSKSMQEHAQRVEQIYTRALGPETSMGRIESLLALPFALVETAKAKLGVAQYQPPTLVNHYPASPCGKRAQKF
jgi:hypothetical protein